jgi:hypothetical protein
VVAPVMLVHDVDDVQRCHWYVYEVGEFVQLPFETVSVWPTFAVPVTAGGVVLPGAAANALAARLSPATIVASSAGRMCFFTCLLLRFVGTHSVFPLGYTRIAT